MPRKGRSSWLNTLDSTRYLISMENYRFLCYRIDYHGPFNEMSSSCVPEQAIWQGADPILPFSILRFPGVWANLILPVLLSGVMVHLPHTFFNGSYVFFTLCFMCMGVLPMCVSVQHVIGALERQKRTQGHLALELQIRVSCHVGVEN